jgi:hypothetical protein
MCYLKHDPQEWIRSDGTRFTLCSWCNTLLETMPTVAETAFAERQQQQERDRVLTWKERCEFDAAAGSVASKTRDEIGLEASLVRTGDPPARPGRQ